MAKTKTADKSIFSMIPKKTRIAGQVAFNSASFFDQTTKKMIDFEKDQLLQRKHVSDLEKIIDIIYPTSKYSPSQLSDTNTDLVNSGTMVRYFPRDHQKSKEALMLAYVLREYRNSYRIFINEDCENESFDSMDLHEKGHVLFNHTQSVNLSMDQFKKELEIIWDDKIVKMLFHEFSNIAQDMEINSKLFDNGEWIKAKKTMARSGILVHLKDLYRDFDDLSGLIKNPAARKLTSSSYKKIIEKFYFLITDVEQRIKGEEGDFQFCYPGNKGWPLKLDWMTYMILLVKDLDETMKQIMKNLNLSGKGSSSASGPNGGKQISQDVLDDYANQQDKEQNAQEDANSDATGSGIGDDDDEGEDETDAAGDSRGTKRNVGGNSQGRGHGAVEVEFETCDTFVNFTKFLRKNCLGKKNRKINSDVLYNSNRGKFASRVVVPRRHLIEKWMPTECHIVVDVSGSVPTDYVERVINSIVDTNSGIDLKHSHIIFCDDEVVSDEIISKRTKAVYAGGGTRIANGIKYAKKYMKKKSDKLFIISDFQDDLNSWINAANGMNGIKYAIGYNINSDSNFNPKRIFSGNNSEFAKNWNKTFNTVMITEKIKQR